MAAFRPGLSAKRTVWLKAGAGIVLVLLAGCAAPYVDSRREAGQLTPVGTSTPNRVAICYTKSATSAEEVRKLAESECAKTGRVPRLDHEDRWTCTMVAPRRIFYSCVAKP
jgi:hypothetical protein